MKINAFETSLSAPETNLALYEIARLFRYVHEVPGNHGLRVNGIQKWGGGSDGDSWCCWFATMMLDIKYQGNAPIERRGSVHDVCVLAKLKGWLTDRPVADDLFVYVSNATGRGHHIGIVTPVAGISGNTTDGTDSDGVCVGEHPIRPPEGSFVLYIHYPRS